MDSPEISRTIRAKTDEREAAHIRSFTKWINSKISKAQPRIKISDLFEDLRNGHALLTLLEVFKEEKLPREKGKLRVHHVSNIEICLKTLEKDNIKLYGISAQAIADGVRKSTLGLVWSIILHYQVHGAMQEEEEEVDAPPQTNTTAASTRKKSRPQTEAAVEDRLLRWVQNVTEGCDDIIQVKDLSKSWRDGKAFNLLIHVHRNDLINLEQVERMSNQGRLEHAFNVAEEHLHVQKLLEPSDVDQENPDKKLVMMYVSSLHENLRQYEPVKPAKRRKVVNENVVASASANVESSLPDTPSEPFLKFKDDLSRTSGQVQNIENNLSTIEVTFENRIDVQLFENYSSEFLVVESEVDKLRKEGMKATNAPSVQPLEAEEIVSDLKALEARMLSVRNRTETQRNRIAGFRKNEEKKLNEWRQQAGVFLDWIDKMDDRLDEMEEIECEDDISALDRQAQVLKDLLHSLNNDPVTRTVFEYGRSLVMSNELLAENQIKVKKQLIEMEKELAKCKDRVAQDIDRYNKNIDNLKRTQSEQMGKWRKEAEAMCDWLDSMEDQLESLDKRSGNDDVKEIYRHLDECEKLHETIKNDARPNSIVERGEMMMAEKTLSKEQKVKIDKQLTVIKNDWKTLIAKSAEVKTRLTTIRDESELEEKHRVEEWIQKFELLLKQMTKAKETIGKLKSLHIVNERNRAFQECIKVVNSIKPEYQNAVECAEEVMTRETSPDWEKSQVKEDVELLKTTWGSVLDAMDEEEKSINGIKSDEQLEKIKEWREKYIDVDKWYQTITPKVEGNFTVGKTLPIVQKQIAEQQEISNEMVMTHESVEFLLANGQQLLQNVNTPEAEKNELRKDIANLVERWESLSNTVNNRMQRLVEMEKHLEENLSMKLEEFSNQANSIEGWLTKEEKKFQAMGVIAPNLEAAMKQKPKVEVLMKEMKQEEKKMIAVIHLGEEILTDSSLSEEDNNRLQQELNTLKNRWEALEEKINWRIQRLNETISRLGSQQQDKLEKWRENAMQISDWLDKAQLRLAERGAIGSDLKTVTAQRDQFQNFLDESLEFQRHIYGFTEFGENLRTDPCINEEERSKVQQKTKTLNDRWDVIVQQINNHHNALEEQLEELEDRHKAELLEQWQEKYQPFSSWLVDTEKTIKVLKDIGDNALVVQRQEEETKVLISQVANKEPDFNDVISIAQTVNDDPLIEDSEAETIEKQARNLSSRWVVVNETLNGRSESLRIRGAFLGEQEQHLLHEWRRNIEPFSKWLSKVEDDGAFEVNESVGVNSIKDYSIRCKTLEHEVEGRKSVLEELQKLGAKLSENSAIRDEEKSHIREEMEILQERWNKLHVKIHDNNKWADIKLIELAKKEKETLDVWRNNVEPFSSWLDETNGKLGEIQKNSGDTENLEQRHLALQRIKEDVTQHEGALARIVTIVSKLTKDDNVSETEKNNIMAEMNRLQEKWNNTQNNVNLNYLGITEALMELAQKEKATLEKWKKQTDLFKEWVVEAKGRFDNLHHGEGYDAVQEQHGKLETLSSELVDHEKNYENIFRLKNTILMDDQLSTSFKDNIKDEGDSLDKKWQELHDNVTSHMDRVQKRMVTLVNSQRDQLSRWQEEFKNINNQQVKTENDLRSFENLALDVSGAKRQSSDLKTVEQEIKVNRSQVEEVCSFCGEISSDPNIANREKTRIKKEAELMKERQNKQEKLFIDCQRKLDGKIRELEDLQLSKLQKWKTSSQPLHEWLDGIADDAKEFDAIGGNIVDVHAQFDELQKLSKEFKETESDLFNVLKVGEDLSTDPLVSEDVRKSVTQDVMLLREDHTNVDELLKSQREKMKSQLLKLQQHQEKCLIDWNERKTSVDIRIKTMEKRTGQWQSTGNTVEDIQSEKDVLKVVEKDLESIQWELTTILEYGETLCKDKSIIDNEKESIGVEMNRMETSFRKSQNNVEDRKLSLNAKLDELRRTRANEFLNKWEKSLLKTLKWMETCENTMQFDIEEQQVLADVRERLDDVDDLSERVENYEPEFNSTIKCGEDVIKEPSVEPSAKEKVEEELSALKLRWQGINSNLETLMSRLEEREVSLATTHDELSEKWHDDVLEIRDWCNKTETKLQSMDKDGDASNYDELSERRKELQIIIEMLPPYEGKINELEDTSRELARNSKNEQESCKFLNETQTLQNDFEDLKQSLQTAKSNHDSMVTSLESAHSQQLIEWNKKGQRIEQTLTNIETKWQEISFLQNSNEDEITLHRSQLETVVSDLKNVQSDYDRHCSVGRLLAKEPALSIETRNVVEQKVKSYEQRWLSLQISRKLLMQLPRVAVDETVMRVQERQVESADMDTLGDLFGVDDGGNCQELMDWYVDYDSSLKWCTDASEKVSKRTRPGEYIILVERQHGEVEELIQLLTTQEATMTRVLDKGQHLLNHAESLRLSKDDRSRLDNDLRTLKTNWDELQENAFDTERSLNEHLNKLREFQDWEEKAGALSQWLEMTDRKLDCCSAVSGDVDEQGKQRIFLEKFVTEKNRNEESITDVFNLGSYIVTNHLILKEKYREVNDDIYRFKNMWNQMLTKADEFCKLFGIPFSHIDMSSSDPLLQWKRKVEEVEQWIADAREKLHLKNNLKDFAVLKALPEIANETTKGIDNYCMPQLNEITSRAQDILNEKESNQQKNAEITETIARLSKDIEDLRHYTESQKVHVRNETLAYFTERLNSSEVMVDRVPEDLKKLRTVGSEATTVRDQVDLIKESENYLKKHLLKFEESKRQIIEMEDKGYLSSDGFEGTLKIKTVELEPRMTAVDKQFSDAKNRLAKGVISFHGQHKDDVKKWLKYCERKLSEIDIDTDDINIVHEEYSKLQELRREIIKGEQSFLSTLELNERLIAEAILNEQQGQEYQGEMQAIAKSRNQLQRKVQVTNSRLYAKLVEGLDGILSNSIHAFETAQATLCVTKLSEDFNTATEQMDGAKFIAENMADLEQKAQITLQLATKITTCGILILKEEDKPEVDGKIKQLKEYAATMARKSHAEFNRLLDDYLVLFRKEIEDRKTWIAVSENRMSLSYLEIEDLPGFEHELKEHKEFEEQLNRRNMEKMVDAADRVTELEKNYKMDVKNLEKRWGVLRQWSDDYSLELHKIVQEWKSIKQEQQLLMEWLDPNEKQFSKINDKINWADDEGMKQQIEDLKSIQSELEDKGVVLSSSHVKGMALMKFLNDEAAASRTIDQDLALLDRRWNTMAKDIIQRIELLRNILYKQADLREKKQQVDAYVDETNAELDEHETKAQRLRGNVSDDVENGETVKEKKSRMKKEKETLQQDVVGLIKSLEERIADFPRNQALVDRINASSKDLENVADEDSKVILHDELVNFNARWQVIVTRLEDYSDNELPDASSLGCMGFMKRRLNVSTF